MVPGKRKYSSGWLLRAVYEEYKVTQNCLLQKSPPFYILYRYSISKVYLLALKKRGNHADIYSI